MDAADLDRHNGAPLFRSEPSMSPMDRQRARTALFLRYPEPPDRDVCASALLVPILPSLRLPQPTWRTGVKGLLIGLGFARPPIDDSEVMAAETMIKRVRTAIGPVQRTPETRRRRSHPGRGSQSVLHPYDLRDAFDLMLRLPDAMAAYRQALDRHLTALLSVHSETLQRQTQTPFQYAVEAREYFVAGLRQEALFHRLGGNDDRAHYAQEAYAGYVHGRWYYLFGLMRGEPLPVGSRMFQYFWRATTFLARISPGGALEEKPKRSNLPTRQAFLFFVRRDRHVQRQLGSNPDFAKRVTTILETLRR